MSQLPTSLSILALGMAGIALVLTARPPRAPAVEPVAQPAGSAPLAERVAELEASNLELAERLARLEIQPATLSRSPASHSLVSRDEVDEVVRTALAEAREADSSLTSPKDEYRPDPSFTRAVEDSMREIRIAKAVQGAEESVRMRSEYLREEIARATDLLGMGSSQTNRLESALQERYEIHSEWGVFKATGEVESREQWEALIEADRADFVTELEEFLTPQQVEDYFGLGDGWAFPYSDEGSWK